MNRELKQLFRELKKDGFTIERTSGDHYKITRGKIMIFTGSTPSDYRSVKNLKARIRRIDGYNA